MSQEHMLNGPRFAPSSLIPGRCVVEVLGPAGAGKSTFVKALREFYSPVQDQPTLLWPDKVRALAGIIYELLPGYVCTRPAGRWFNVEELRRMSYVKAWHRLISQSTAPEGTITILDHGPIFMLGMVQEFGPVLVNSRDFARWSESAIAAWSDALGLVLWLDAPNATLVQRIGLRDHHHIVKGKPFLQACDFLERCRRSFGRILSEIEALGHLKILHFDTSVLEPDDIVKQFLQAIDAQLATARDDTNRTTQQALDFVQEPDNVTNSRPVQAWKDA